MVGPLHMPLRQFAIAALIVIAANLFSTGCSLWSPRPQNRVVPAPTFMSHFTNLDTPGLQVPNHDDQWAKCFFEELNQLEGWSPEGNWLKPNCPSAEVDESSDIVASTAKEFGLDVSGSDYKNYINEVKEQFRSSAPYFTNFSHVPIASRKITSDPAFLLESTNLWQKAMDTLYRIDLEHQMILDEVNEALKKDGGNHVIDRRHQSLFTDKPSSLSIRGGRPQMVSPVYPVGVALSVVHSADEESASAKAEKGGSPQIMVNSQYKGPEPPPQIMVQSSFDGTGTNGPKAAAKSSGFDFNPIQDVTLTLSTVLNSADVLDRIEYVSTFVFVYPYQRPPSGGVSLDREFWRHFFSYQVSRNQSVSGDRFLPPTDLKNDRKIHHETRGSIKKNLERAFDELRVQFRNVNTTVVTNEMDLGQVTRNFGSSIAATLAASMPVPPAALSPGLSANLNSSVTAAMKSLRQLDERSAYVAPDCQLVRITQRGMINANLGGALDEKVQLNIPEASDPVCVIQLHEGDKPGKDAPNSSTNQGPLRQLAIVATTNSTQAQPQLNSSTNQEPAKPQQEFHFLKLGQPVYSQVDALVISIAVVRHPVSLRRTRYDAFGLSQDDAADTDFIVAIPLPSIVTLWKWDRSIDNVDTASLDPRLPTKKNRQVFFDVPNSPLTPNPLYLTYPPASENTLPLQFRSAIYRALANTNNNQNSQSNIYSQIQYSSYLTNSKSGTGFYIIVTNHIPNGEAIRLGFLQPGDPPQLVPFGTNYFPSHIPD